MRMERNPLVVLLSGFLEWGKKKDHQVVVVFSLFLLFFHRKEVKFQQNHDVEFPTLILEIISLTFCFLSIPPTYSSIIPGGQTQAAALEDFGTVQGSPYTWTANIPAGTSITIKITDSAGL